MAEAGRPGRARIVESLHQTKPQRSRTSQNLDRVEEAACTQSFLTQEDMLKLQGIPTEHASVAKELQIPSRVLAGMIGNGISVDVLEVILARLLTALGK